MNKDVIYIEPENDITDIITKIESSKQKIVALVPPKKAGVFRSIVNIKLITKVATSSKKTVVLVTTDPSITKLAAATKLPVTKDLQSAPAIPKADTNDGEEDTEKVKEEKEKEEEPKVTDEEEEEADEDKKEDDDDEEEDKKDDEANKKRRKRIRPRKVKFRLKD